MSGKRGPRKAPLSVLASPDDLIVEEIPRERPQIPWDRIVLKEDQAAEFLKCSPQTLRKRAARGEVPRYGVGGEWRYYVYDLLDYVLGAACEPTGGTDRWNRQVTATLTGSPTGAGMILGDPERAKSATRKAHTPGNSA